MPKKLCCQRRVTLLACRVSKLVLNSNLFSGSLHELRSPPRMKIVSRPQGCFTKTREVWVVHSEALSLGPTTNREAIANAGKRAIERTVGAPTIAAAMIAAAQRMACEM